MKALERLALHPALWPIVLELTGGRPQVQRSPSLAIGSHD
jgi:hypothetical protein